MHSYIGLEEKNRQLAQHNLVLERRVEALQRLLDETSEDSVIEERFSDYTVIEARVVNATVRKRNNYITINKGESDGVRPEMGVVCGNGVVGIVYLTGKHHAIVLPVLNSKSSISCKIKRTSYFGFLKWEGGSSQYAYVKDMPRHSEFSLGDTIVTSGHSAVFPAGIPVGTVDDMEDSHDGLSYLLKVKLFTDFARLNNVRVLGSFNGTEQAQLEDSIHSMQP